MAEELIQRGLLQSPEQIGDWSFYNIGSTTLKQLKAAKIIPNRDYNEFERKKPDALIVQKPNVIAAIEYKDPSEFNTPAKVKKGPSRFLVGSTASKRHQVHALLLEHRIARSVLRGETAGV